MIPKPIIQIAESAIPVIREALENPTAALGAFEKAAYEAWPIAPRVANAAIRTAENVAAGTAKWGDESAKVADESIPWLLKPLPYSQRSLTPGNFAQMIHTDAGAFKAVSTVERQTIGLHPRMAEAAATEEQMQKAAMEGAIAYLGKGGNANKFTQYLIGRFGSA